MSFLKITNPKKRDLIVKEFLKTKQNIQNNYLTERLGDINVQREMTKMFKPITETQKDVKESLLGELKPIRENLKELPAALTFPQQLQAITAPPEEGEDLNTSGLFIGPIAEQYLRQFASEQEVDKTFGITGKHGSALPVVRVMYVFNGEGRFSGCCPERTPGRIEMAFGTRDYVRHGTPHANFGGDRFSSGDWANTPCVPLVYDFLLVTFLTPSVRLQPRPLNRFRRLMAQTTRLGNH